MRQRDVLRQLVGKRQNHELRYPYGALFVCMLATCMAYYAEMLSRGTASAVVVIIGSLLFGSSWIVATVTSESSMWKDVPGKEHVIQKTYPVALTPNKHVVKRPPNSSAAKVAQRMKELFPESPSRKSKFISPTGASGKHSDSAPYFNGHETTHSYLRNKSTLKVNYFRKQMTTTNINIVTYNVLSSHLAGADYFTNCNPKYLKSDYRFDILKKKLQEKMNQNAIICLQEISTLWSGKLHIFFLERNYCMIDTHYGNRFNGYMGVAMAFPKDHYKLQDVDITCIADTKIMPRKPKLSFFWKIYERATSYMYDVLNQIGMVKKVDNPWSHALRRNNRMISARFSPHSDLSKQFVIGTYHMPCMFRLPSVMLIHSALSAQHLRRYAKGDPCAYVGDFNVKPDSSMYQLLTTGKVEQSHPEMPVIEEGDSYKLDVIPFRSAYKESNGSEPQFTNNAQVRDEEPFIDTLDYIFLSEEWKINSVEKLPTLEEIKGPMPVETEPSDHLLLAADVNL